MGNINIDAVGLIRLRRMRRWSIFYVAAYILVAVIFFIETPVTGTPALGAILALAVLSVLHLRTLECPQCGSLFYADGKWGRTNLSIPFARICRHCGFSLEDD